MQNMRTKTFILFILAPLISWSINIDSLQQAVKQSKEDSNKVESLILLAEEMQTNDRTEAITQLNKANDLAVKLNYKKGEAKANKTLGNLNYLENDYVNAIIYWEKAAEKFNLINDNIGKSAVISNIGAVYYNQGDYTKAMKFYLESLEISEHINDSIQMATVYQNIGAIHYETNEDNLALINYQKALSIFEKINYYDGIGLASLNIGMLYTERNEFTKALYYLESSLPYLKNTHYYTSILRSIGKVKTNIYGIEDGIVYIDSAFSIAKASKDSFDMARTYNAKAGLYLDLNNTQLAIKYFENAKSLLKNSQRANYELQTAAKGLTELYERNNRYTKAFENLKLYQQISDSIKSFQANQKINQMLFNYELDKKESEMAYAIELKNSALETEKAKRKQSELKANQQQRQKYYLFGSLGIVLIFVGFIFNRFQVTRRQKRIIEKQKSEVDKAYSTLEEKNNEITDSISYAKRIQNAIIPPITEIKKHFNESFVLYLPKDIVAGDFYWIEKVSNTLLIAAADCTGHGVPGAMVSVVCNNALNRSVREYNHIEPGQILDRCREIVVKEFEKSHEDVKDGMDIALVSLKKQAHNENENESAPHSHSSFSLSYAGANNPIWIIRKDSKDIEEIKANKQPIGKSILNNPFDTHTVELNKGDAFYIFSDGYADQFGGEKGKKMKNSSFKKLLLSINEVNMENQKMMVLNHFNSYKGDLEQLDDVCVIGIRV